MACNGLKMGSFDLIRHAKWSRIIFGKTQFWPILDPFLVVKQPIFKAFWDFRRAKTGLHELKMRQNHCFGIPCGPGSFLKKAIFLQLVTHLGTHLLGLPLAACRGPLGLGTGV